MNNGEAYLGVYYPVDPSTYDKIYPKNPNKNVTEIAGLFTGLIQLFIDMRYLDKEKVAFPPHEEHPINPKYPARFGLTKDVVDMYQMIPYVLGAPNWNHGSDAGEFVGGGEFLDDLRQIGSHEEREHVWEATWEHAVIDPCYGIDWHPYRDDPERTTKINTDMDWDAEHGPYIRPWYAVLSAIGNHGSFMCLNTKNWHMWLAEQLGGSSDPGLRGLPPKPRKPNVNDLENEHSRPAVDLLRDLIQRFRNLEWMPGGLYDARYLPEYGAMKDMYESAGWPDNFDPEKFDRLRSEYEEAEVQFRRQTSPLEDLDNILQRIHEREKTKKEISDLEIEIPSLERRLLEQADPETQEELDHKYRCLAAYRNNLREWTKEEWEESQANMREELSKKRTEKKLFLDRQGRFAGMTDEEHEKAVKDRWFDDEIQRFEILVADKSEEARRRREEKEIREAVAAIDPEIIEEWLERRVQWSRKDGEWVMEWTQFMEAGQDLG